MLRHILTAAALVSVLGTAQAGSLLEATEHGSEVPLAELDLPAAEGGILRFALCGGCETHTTAMSSGTRYVLNHKTVTFEELEAAVETAQASTSIAERSIVGLYFDISSKRLVRIAVVAPIPPQ
jgi:hypothetical protein